jgi:hypothetical protein
LLTAYFPQLLFLLLLPTALVKVLRRCVRDMASKSSAFVELCVKTEKEAAQEVRCKHTVCWVVAQNYSRPQTSHSRKPCCLEAIR